MKIYQLYENISAKNEVLLGLAIILIAAFLLTRLTKLLRLPDVSAYIIAGVVIGPDVLGLISPEMVEGCAFLKDFSLACVAFGIGKFFTVKNISKGGAKALVITLVQVIITGAVVTLAVKLFGLNWDFSLLLGSIAMASSPTSTMMTINQYHAKGEFVDYLLQVVAICDIICIFAFSIVLAVTAGNAGSGGEIKDIILPVIYNLAAILVGIAVGFLTGKWIRRRSPDNRLMLGLAMLAILTAACGLFDVSPLLCSMFYGATYINFTKDKELFRQLDKFKPPIMCVFFAVSGMGFDLGSVATAGVIALVYFAVRMLGKYLGSLIGCACVKASKPVRNWLGLTMIPQASVSIGLAALAADVLGGALGALATDVILPAAILYELVGPALSKLALIKSGSIGKALPEKISEVVPVDGDWDKPERSESDWDKPAPEPDFAASNKFGFSEEASVAIPKYDPSDGYKKETKEDESDLSSG